MAPTDRFLLFIEYFNNGKFMSAQTTLDEDWIEQEGERKIFLAGLIQTSVTMYHMTNGNPQGACKIWYKAKAMLEPHTPAREGIDLAKLIEDMDELCKYVSDQLTDLDYMGRAPKIKFNE